MLLWPCNSLTSMLHHRVCNNIYIGRGTLLNTDNRGYQTVSFSNKHIGIRGWVRISRFCWSHDIWKYRGVPYNVEMLESWYELNVLPINDSCLLGGQYSYLHFYVMHKCTLVHLISVNPEKYALALMKALFTDKKIASSCYCVMMKRSKKTTLPMEKKGIFKCICFTPAPYRSLRKNGCLHF